MGVKTLVRNWWMVAIRGLLAIAFGLALLLWPSVSLPIVVVLFGVYAMLDGVWAVASAIRVADRRVDSWPVAVEGLASVVLGFTALAWPFVSREFIYVVSTWGIATGALEIITALRMSRETAAHWLWGTAGVASVFLGGLILMLPHADVVDVMYAIAAYALLFGGVVSGAAVRFRAVRGPVPRILDRQLAR
jgi:uncharacterized membrane protein HdeD (DUF308 family)